MHWTSVAFNAAASLTISIILLCCPGNHNAQTSNNSGNTRHVQATVNRAKSRIVVDGLLNETDWVEAAPVGEILQREPHEGEKATEVTDVKLLYDDQYLYIGVDCHDNEPNRIIGTQMERDADLSSDDRIEILIDTFHDRHNAYYFSTNPLGALVDGLIIENGQLNRNWNAIWVVRTHKSEAGWTAEFAIPFKSIGFKAGNQVWGFNFSRTIKRKLEEDRWASPRLDLRFFQVAEAGEINGLSGIHQGRGLDVRPFVSMKALHNFATGNDISAKGGVDVFYNITPSLKLTTTINTDFGETEVDSRQINLTRFELFFPEKRSFFLENAGVFNFGPDSDDEADLIAFFSRRIGLLESGQEVPILAGVKLTGKQGPYTIGVVAIRTRETDFIEAKNFFVARIKRDFLKQSYFGAIYTEGNPEGTSSSRTFGGDVRLFTSKFLGKDQNFGVDAFALKTQNTGLDGKDYAYGLGFNCPSDLWTASASWKRIGENFRPALGFVPRSSVDKLSLGFEFDPRPKDFLNVRQMFHEIFFNHFRRTDKGSTESWRLFTAPINYELNSGEHIEFNYAPQFERLFEPFEIAKGVVLPPGSYRFTRWRFEINTASKRRWKFDNAWWFGSYWSGHAHQFSTQVQYKVVPHLLLSAGWNQTFARLAQGNFVARVFTVRANYSVNPYLTFFNLVQFDNDSKNMGWQSRVRWILRPGNELFLVFNQGWLQDERGGFNFRAVETKFSGKFQYTFRF
ncbi:MAG TPA: DUF5916 domain-containing protein [Blastocatellia bacterium]|nr:DUF5916 domain-containing protein [Blastocatellia bacterium]